MKAVWLSGLLALASCTSIVRPPERSVGDVEVLLISETWHSGLVLPGEQGQLVEWGYGSFDWYALGHDRWYDAFLTVLWPNRGTLGRREWDAQERARRSPEDCVAFRAPRERVQGLVRELEQLFEGAQATRVWNEGCQTAFVEHSREFWALQDCHDETAVWLARLGCRVEPSLVRLGLALRLPSAPRDALDD